MTNTLQDEELQEKVMLAMGIGNWKRLHPTSQEKLMALIHSHVIEARIDEAQRTYVHIGFNASASADYVSALEELSEAHNRGVDNRIEELQKLKDGDGS